MPQIPALALAFLLLTVAACAGETKADPGLAFGEHVAETLEEVGAFHAALDDPEIARLPSEAREERYREIDEGVRALIETTEQIDVPQGFAEAHSDLSAMLVNEREIWVHMVLYARTGQELHSVLAGELAFDASKQVFGLLSLMRAALVAAGIDAADVGLDAVVFAAARPSSGEQVEAPPTPTPIPAVVAAPTSTATPPSPTPQATATLTPFPTATPSPVPSPSERRPSPTPLPAATASPTPSPTPTPTATATAVPSPTPAASPTPAITEGELVVIRFQDRRGSPAFVAHWIVDLEPGALAAIEYPFVAGDDLEISVVMGLDALGTRLRLAYMEGPDRGRLVQHEDFQRPQNTDVAVEAGGLHRFYFDNTSSEVHMVAHLLITYHEAAPGSVIPPERN